MKILTEICSVSKERLKLKRQIYEKCDTKMGGLYEVPQMKRD